MGGYKPHKDSISYFLSHISKVIDANMINYENLILLGDFNAVDSYLSLTDFCEMYTLKNLIIEPTCYKNPNNPSVIDIILTNRRSNFQDSKTMETGLSDHHKMVITVLKSEFKKKDHIKTLMRTYSGMNYHLHCLIFSTKIQTMMISIKFTLKY